MYLVLAPVLLHGWKHFIQIYLAVFWIAVYVLQRGVRQGDPLSPYLIVIAAEILAFAIQTNTDIQGLKIGKEEFKLVQYADDLTVFVPNVACAQLVFHLLDQFRFCSGLKVNYTKTEAMWIGSSRDSTATPLGLTWRGSVKALGIVFTYNTTVQLQTNFYDKLKEIRTQTRLWSCRGLSLFGKITIIKSFLLPKMLYIFQFCLLQRRLLNNSTLSFTTFCGRDPLKLLDQQ